MVDVAVKAQPGTHALRKPTTGSMLFEIRRNRLKRALSIGAAYYNRVTETCTDEKDRLTMGLTSAGMS